MGPFSLAQRISEEPKGETIVTWSRDSIFPLLTAASAYTKLWERPVGQQKLAH
jgi:hypothetical protein